LFENNKSNFAPSKTIGEREQAMKKSMIKHLGFDLSTTALSVGGRTEGGQEVFTSMPIRGAATWNRQPAFDLQYVASMILILLGKLGEQGWEFTPDGALSFSVRQHDMVLLDKNGNVIMPALSWQCVAASAQVARLKKLGVETVVGNLAERFILPKLMWTLEVMDESTKNAVQVMTTGDWITLMLTGNARLSTSDAMSNGLLDQQTKKLAVSVLKQAGLNPKWFPEVIQSGEIVGTVQALPSQETGNIWDDIKRCLAGWKVIAPLGDNHAGAVGCGLADSGTIVFSTGTSGTVVRMCAMDATLTGQTAQFEYYLHRLLLLMLARCCAWYEDFKKQWAPNLTYKELDDMAMKVRFEDYICINVGADGREIYPENWEKIPLDVKVASVQASISAALIKLVGIMLTEVRGAAPITRVVLTGGLSQSPFFRQIFKNALFAVNPDLQLLISDRQGPLASQAATFGALINAMVGAGEYPNLGTAISELCPLKPCD